MTNTDLLLNLAPERLVQVALERGIDRYPEGLTYAAPEALGPLCPGDRVVVPLGRGNTPTSGWILAVHDGSTDPELTPSVDPLRVKAVLRLSLIHI